MSVLGVIGRGYSTYQLIVSIIISIGLIGGGIYLLSTNQQPIQPPSVPGMPAPPQLPVSNTPRQVGGIVMIIVGVLSPIVAWLRRKIVRSSPELAEVVGGLDVIKVLGI